MSESAENKPDEGESPEDIRAQIEAIKAENLTGQQLRMARRLAQKHGLAASSDLDAVRLLRKNDIDPFMSANNPLDMAMSAGQQTAESKEKGGANLPAKRPQTQLSTAQERERENAEAIMAIQRDLVRRRRMRIIQLFTRLFFFVALPTILAGYYFAAVATPMYSAKSEFTIQSSGGSGIEGAPSIFGGMLQDAKEGISVQGQILSIEAMLELDQKHNFISVFKDESIDPIQRLDPDATNEAAFKTYKKHVRVGFDPTEGILRMEVSAPNPDLAIQFSDTLFDFAEARLDEITKPVREDQLSAARALYNDAESKLADARQRVLDLQSERGIVSGELEVQIQMNQISTLETSLLERRLTLAEIEANPRPNTAQKQALQNQIAELERAIGEARAKLTSTSADQSSIALISGELRQAQAEVQLRQELLSQSILGLEAATIDAARQSKFLGLSVRPIKPQSAAYPRVFEMTLISFFVFLGIYLMIALTGSILREQMSN